MLVLCPACSRHVRSPEVSCPFCRAPIEARSTEVTFLPSGSTRAKIFLGALAISAATSAGCSKFDPTEHTPSVMPAYGVPAPPDAGGHVEPSPSFSPLPVVLPDAGASASPDAALPLPSPVAPYGAPPPPNKAPAKPR